MNDDLPVFISDGAHIRKKQRRYNKRAIVMISAVLCVIFALALFMFFDSGALKKLPKGSETVSGDGDAGDEGGDYSDIYSFDMSSVGEGETAVLPIDILSGIAPSGALPTSFEIPQGRVLIVSANSFEAYLSESAASVGDEFSPTGGEHTLGALGAHMAFELCRIGIDAEYIEVGSESRRGASAAERRAIEAYLAENDVSCIIDLRRGVLMGDGGEILRPITEHNGATIAQMRLIVSEKAGGTDSRYNSAMYLAETVSKASDNVIRAVIGEGVPNQDMHELFFTLEIGSAGNTFDEAEAAADLFISAIGEVTARG